MESETTIVRADPKVRMRYMIITMLIIIAGAALIHWGAPVLRARIQQLYDSRQIGDLIKLLRIIEGVMVLIFIGFLPFAVRTLRTGLQVAREKHFPLPGMVVLSDTPILDGKPALRRAVLYYILAGALFFTCVAGIFTVHILLNRIINLL
jgi:hypothetical protein